MQENARARASLCKSKSVQEQESVMMQERESVRESALVDWDVRGTAPAFDRCPPLQTHYCTLDSAKL